MFNWCFIGTGTLAKSVAKEITESGQHKIVSVYTRNFEKGKAFAEAYGARAYDNPEKAIADADVDGVYIVTPHSSHHEYVKLAVDLGKPVLCEKPFSTDTKKTEETLKYAESKGVYVTEAMWTWFADPANKVKEWLDKGEFGEIKKVEMSYIMNAYKYAPRLTDANVAGGALLDIGVYPLTYLYRLFGYPDAIKCKGKIIDGCDYHEKIWLSYGDKTFTVSVSMKDRRVKEDAYITGSKAKIRLHHFHVTNNVTLLRKDGTEEYFEGQSSMLNEFNRASQEMQEGLLESPHEPHEATIQVMKIMDECRRQMGLVYPFEK